MEKNSSFHKVLFNASINRLFEKYEESMAFDDFLIKPTYTDIASRSIPSTETEIAGFSMKAPIISSPMDTITESDMAIKMSELGGLGIVHRFMPIDKQVSQLNLMKDYEDVIGSSVKKVFAVGVGQEEYVRAERLIRAGADAIAIDVANGHSSYMGETIVKIKQIKPSIKIIAGNVATGEGYDFLVDCGADAVRVGIGGGCFVPGTMIITDNGTKPIESVLVGESVRTHTGSWKKVIDTMEFDRDEEIVSINGIECTKNHEFYVVNKSDAEFITEDNIHDYAFWIESDHLNPEKHLLIELD